MGAIKYPFYYYAEYTDGTEFYVKGISEEECIGYILDEQKCYGKCKFYTGIDGDGYVSGEYVGNI